MKEAPWLAFIRISSTGSITQRSFGWVCQGLSFWTRFMLSPRFKLLWVRRRERASAPPVFTSCWKLVAFNGLIVLAGALIEILSEKGMGSFCMRALWIAA